MSINENYNYEGLNFVIKNGIISGANMPYVIEFNNYGEVILEKMRSNPKFIAQVDALTGREETLGEMMEKSVKCAMWMKKFNIQPGDIVGICTHNQMDMYIPSFASMFIGAVFNYWWNIGLNKDDVMAEHFLTLTKPKILFANEASANLALQVAEKIGMDLKVVVFGTLPGFESLENLLESQDSKFVSEFRCTQLSSVDDTAMIVYTSGSTGMPKGAVLSHKSLAGNIFIDIQQSKEFSMNRTMQFSLSAWLCGVYALFRIVVVPETRIMYPEFKEEKTLELIEKYKINWMIVPPNFASRLQKCSTISKYDLSSVKLLYVIGSVLKPEIQDAIAASFPNTTVLHGYGSTEIGRVAISQTSNVKCGSCGTVTMNMMIKIIDPDTKKVLGPNEIGVACLKSPFMMTCYYKNPEDTNDTIDDEGWLHTGDLFKYDEEGHFYFIERIKEFIKFRGQHVSPLMIEQVLLKHPKVSEVTVIGIPHDDDGEHPTAFVVTTPNADVTKEELEKMVTDTLPDYMALRGSVQFLKELPRTGSNKIARAELRNLAQAHSI